MVTLLTQKLDFLSKHELFQGLHPNDLERLARASTIFSCKRGHHFYRAGETGEVLFILKEGLVHRYRLTSRGRKLIVTTLTPGAIFGQLNLMGQKIYHTFAVVVIPSDVCIISHLELIGLMRRKPRLVVKFMEIVSQRIIKAERRLAQMVFLTVPSRLALLLLDLNDRNIDLGSTTHQDLADMLGTYRETVSTAIMDFRALGFIHATRTQFKLIDRQGLEAFVERSVMLTQIQIKR